MKKREANKNISNTEIDLQVFCLCVCYFKNKTNVFQNDPKNVAIEVEEKKSRRDSIVKRARLNCVRSIVPASYAVAVAVAVSLR